jgi:uncharacterized protein YggU (UPF0235/DUF167 family)
MQQTELVVDAEEHGATMQIWVRPGSSRTRVGGEHAGALAVAVTAPAADGAATEAALAALARALGLPRRSVWLVRGTTARLKTVGVDLSGEDLARRVTGLTY